MKHLRTGGNNINLVEKLHEFGMATANNNSVFTKTKYEIETGSIKGDSPLHVMYRENFNNVDRVDKVYYSSYFKYHVYHWRLKMCLCILSLCVYNAWILKLEQNYCKFSHFKKSVSISLFDQHKYIPKKNSKYTLTVAHIGT